MIEYAKAMEIYEKRYHPAPDDLFQIFIQFARFFKEFSDFETEDIPIFRHPPIIGGTEVENIGLYPEIDKMNMYWGDIIIQALKSEAKQNMAI